MRLLILGGTGFLGRTVAVRALRRGWTVTVFNRGLSGAPPAGAAVIRGDRQVPSDLTALTESTWDGWLTPGRAHHEPSGTACRHCRGMSPLRLCFQLLGVSASAGFWFDRRHFCRRRLTGCRRRSLYCAEIRS